MNSSNSGVGQEVVYRVGKTRKGYKVVEYDGRGLADGYCTKSYSRYFYADDYTDADQSAHEYARERAEEIGDDARVVELGERW